MSYKLWDYLVEQHDLTLLDSELAEIVHHVHKEHGYDELKEAVKEMRDAQKRFFNVKTDERRKELLILSKKLEARVDELISDKLF